MTKLTKKETPFIWQKAFNKIKADVAELIMLSYPNLNKPFEVYTDKRFSNGRIGDSKLWKKCDFMFLQKVEQSSEKLSCYQKGIIGHPQNFET